MDQSRKAAVITANRIWDAATELESVLHKYNQYMRMAAEGDEDGKVLISQLLKDLPKWLVRLIETLNEAGCVVAEANEVRFNAIQIKEGEGRPKDTSCLEFGER